VIVGQKPEIIDLEETVCRPRYECGATRSDLFNKDLAYTDQNGKSNSETRTSVRRKNPI